MDRLTIILRRRFIEAALQDSEAAGANDNADGIAWSGYRCRLATIC
ncbi:MAG: hypothetical protein M3115_02015 [Thermoproteota archaeon]|nr:hypothetical protein [Thermoproteota archaeon]